MHRNRMILIVGVAMLTAAIAGCNPAPTVPPTPTTPPLAEEITIYGWAEDLPQEIFDGFTEEFGVNIRYEAYSDQEQAASALRDGAVYDIVVFDNEKVPQLAGEGLLAELEHGLLTNFRNISPNFRDLAHDPGNKHSVPYNWGIWGFMVNRDAAAESVTKWADLWSDEFSDKKIATFPLMRYTVGMTLKSLGYSINSEDPEELEEAHQRLLDLSPNLFFAGEEDWTTTAYLIDGSAIVGTAGSRDVMEADGSNVNIEFVAPEEGIILWGDNFTIPASSPNSYTAHLFLDYMMRPEVNAQVVEWNNYATPNDAARELISEDIANNPAIFPPVESLQNAEIMLPVSEDALAIYNSMWDEFMTAMSQG